MADLYTISKRPIIIKKNLNNYKHFKLEFVVNYQDGQIPGLAQGVDKMVNLLCYAVTNKSYLWHNMSQPSKSV